MVTGLLATTTENQRPQELTRLRRKDNQKWPLEKQFYATGKWILFPV